MPDLEEIERQFEAGRRMRALAERASQVRGRHYIQWVSTLDELREQGDDEQALPLLLEIIEAAERAAQIQSLEPPPGYTERAAVIYRRQGNLEAEVAILRRYLDACPPGRGGLGTRIGQRLRRLTVDPESALSRL
jgi:hypothetical protein